MNTFALILALVAVLLFLATMHPKARYWFLPLGLACFAASFIVQLVFNAGPFVTH